MVVVGLIAVFADLVLWSSLGTGYARRTYAEPGSGYGPSGGWVHPRRRVVEEEEAGPQWPGY